MPDAPRRIWVCAPTWVGDVVMATPALRALRRSQPQAEIVLEARASLADLVQGLGSIDRFLPTPPTGLRATLLHSRQLRQDDFDWAVLLPDSVRKAVAPWLARIPSRVGYARDPSRRALLTQSLPPPHQGRTRVAISMIERYLRITRALGCADAGEALEVVVDPGATERVARRLGGLGVSPQARLLIVTPGASFGSSKLWPTEHFARACEGIAATCELDVVLAPGPGEEAIASSIVSSMQRPGLALTAPVLGLAELVALIDRGTLLLTNDTGPRHIAVALDRPTVVVMGPTDPRHTAHLLDRQRVLREDVECSPCHKKTCPIDHRCMMRLQPARAVNAARELLS